MIERIWSGGSLLYLALLPLSWLYGLFSWLIRLSYRCGLRKAGARRCRWWWWATSPPAATAKRRW